MKAVVAILKAASSVTDDLENGASGVKHIREAQGELVPYVVVRSRIINPNTTQTGQKMDDWEVRVFVVSKYAYSDAAGVVAADTISGNVRTALHNVSGTYDGQNVAWIEFIDQGEPEEYGVGNDRRIQIEQTYIVSVKR